MIFRALLLLMAALSAVSASPLNFVFILSDDQAWNGLSRRMAGGLPQSGSDFHRTPNIDLIGAEGMTFSRAYSPAPKCEPSRHAILFGMTTTSLNASDKRTARNMRGVAAHSLANALKRANPAYVAATFGKWQIAVPQATLGFDRDDGRITQNKDGESPDPADPKRMFELTEKGNRFMEDSVRSGRPFYLQLWHYAVHGSNQSLPHTLDEWSTRPPGRLHRDPTRAAMAADFDRAVGMTLAKIDELGIRDSTYVIYMSDNGGPTRFLRGGKTNVTEGGIRVPMAVRGPGIEPGGYCDTPVVAYDLLPTVLDLVTPGIVVPPDVEGGSWRPLLLGGCADPVKRPKGQIVFFFEEARGRDPGPQAAIIDGDWKLIYFWGSKKAQLFDVSKDSQESRDLVTQHPDLAAGLQGRLMAHVRTGLGEEAFARVEAGRTPAPRVRRRDRQDSGARRRSQRRP